LGCYAVQSSKFYSESYIDWKGWGEFLSCTAAEAEYFAAEFRSEKIADGDVLEIGFGSGAFLKWAKDNGARVFGYEVNEALCDTAERNAIALIDISSPDIVNQHIAMFDTIVALDVMEHIPIDDIPGVLSSIEKLLRRGGAAILRFPNAQSPFGLAPQHGDVTHLTALSRGKFEQLLAGTALKITAYRNARIPIGRSVPIVLVRLARRTLRNLISSLMSFAYAHNLPLDPVVVLVLRKS